MEGIIEEEAGPPGSRLSSRDTVSRASFHNLGDSFHVAQSARSSSPNVSERQPSRGSPTRPPVTFKADPKPRTVRSNGLPMHDQTQQLRTQLPPLVHGSDYLAKHHSLLPKTRGSSAYIKRHHGSHGLLPGQARTAMLPQEQLVDSTMRSAILSALACNAELQPRRVIRSAGTESKMSQWSSTSVGDLEVLDSILDNLVVKDANMREALLRGPLISFETVVAEPKVPVRQWYQDPEYKDETFITGVQGVEEAGQEEEEAPVEEPAEEQAPASPQQPGSHPELLAPYSGAQQSAPMDADDLELLRSTIPVPILPKLARMYITTKHSQHAKMPPLPPPTADYLVKSRPGHAITAPSYDDLCTQIRDVQRQYTCGTAKDRNTSPGRAPAPQNNLDMYISGLDGPSLDEMVNYEELPVGLERGRPSFVALKKGAARSVKSGRLRSTSRERYRTGRALPEGFGTSGPLSGWEGSQAS